MFWFELGREYKLSIAEILNIFPFVKVIWVDEKVCIIEWITREMLLKKADRFGGTIKIFEIQKQFPVTEKVATIGNVIKDSLLSKREGKLSYGLSLFWKNSIDQKKFLMNLKHAFKEAGVNSRFINQDFKNLSSAQIIGEKLVKKETDINLVCSDDKIYLWTTLWIQDIEAYGKRDYGKVRDIETIGMLPPKLAQMMINLSSDISLEHQSIYDPFVGLGTLLIESLHMGNTSVFWSDYNPEMLASSNKNILDTRQELWIEKWIYEIIELNAKDIQNSPLLKNYKIDAIVTEGYLWKLFTWKTLTLEWIKDERILLASLYTDFFEGLKKASFSWTTVISFPFWEVQKKYYYFEEIYQILEKYCTIESLLSSQISFKATKVWSLLYKRPNQIVGREIFKLKMK
jgi:tRNA G10  N-methylase Trm11